LGEDDDEDSEEEDVEAEEGRSGSLERPAVRRDPSAVGERQPLLTGRSYSKTRNRRIKSGPGQGTASVTQATLMVSIAF
jgi:hypothetical protein